MGRRGRGRRGGQGAIIARSADARTIGLDRSAMEERLGPPCRMRQHLVTFPAVPRTGPGVVGIAYCHRKMAAAATNSPDSGSIPRMRLALLNLLRDMRNVSVRAIDGYDGRTHTREEHTFIFFLTRATECLGALDHLLVAGWKSDATTLLRTLADIFLEVLYIETDRATLLVRFTDFGAVEALRGRDRYATAYGLDPDELLRREYEAVKDHIDLTVEPKVSSADEYVACYREYVAALVAKWKFKPKRGWSPLSAREKAEAIDRHRALSNATGDAQLVYETAYSMGSEAVHAGFRGITQGNRYDGASVMLHHSAWPVPEHSDVRLLIHTAHLYLKILDNISDVLSLKLSDDLRRFNDSLREVVGPRRAPTT